MTIRIANAAGFWGDDPDAPRRLLASAEVDYLTLEYLAELTMSILAHHRAKDPDAGFATDFLAAMRDILPVLNRRPNLKIITNAGGINPHACAQAVARQMVAYGLSTKRIAVVSGDDLLPRLTELQAVCPFQNLDTGESLSNLKERPASANAYLGASPIAEGLAAGAHVVITGRVADASLTLGPVMFEYGWSWDDWDRLAAATAAGHLIECGAQVTGGYSDRWQEIELADIGYPIAEIEPDGSTIITKPPGSGGVVDRRSVTEQLVYEIGNPAAYITPDVIADFTTIEVTKLQGDRVLVRGATGKPAPDCLKVSLAYPAGFTASAVLLVRGACAESKARFVGKLVFERLRRRGIILAQTNIECLGAGDGIPITEDRACRGDSQAASEVVLRLSVQDPRRSVVEDFTQQIATLITSGPSGLAGYASGRPTVRPVLAYWPTLVPKSVMAPVIDVRCASDWCAGD
jgi:hypothetical protein